ncbi:MAG: hypothetical protein HZB65_01650 [Candidatus Aenigmarchaeota archaeon]|nr:hypothetical protein [Candidatus Aenigmarchaeota archaeon]
MEEEHKHQKKDSVSISANLVIAGLLIVTLAVLVFNQFAIAGINAKINGGAITGQATGSGNTGLSGVDVIPKGIPPIYGSELGVSFDDVSVANPSLADATIKKLGSLDNQISLSGSDLDRYISIASKISCEYCCGVESIIFSDGSAACGCAHSYAMRGLAKYLITEHPTEYTDDQILEELGKWKTLFFPGVITKKAQVLQSQGIELNYINLASNKYRGIENQASSSGSSGAMVGGC